MSQDFRGFLQQMQGCAVSVVTWDHARLLGTLAAVTDDCIRMTGVVLQDSHDTGGWSDRLLIEDLLEDRGNQWPEIIIQRNLISTVTMVSESTRAVSAKPLPLSDPLEGLDSSTDGVSPDLESAVEHSSEHTESVRLELGAALARMQSTAGDLITHKMLVERMTATRVALEKALGFQLQPFRVQSSSSLAPNLFRVLIHGVEVSRGTIMAGKLMAILSEGSIAPPPGAETIEPIYSLPAVWIDSEDRHQAEASGCTVVDGATIMGTMLDCQVRKHAKELLTYEAVSAAVDKLRETHPVTVANLIPHPVSLRSLFEVLRGLVGEGVVIRHLLPILESVARHVEHCESMPILLSRVRCDIPLILCGPHLDERGRLPVVVIDAAVAHRLFSESSESNNVDGSTVLTLFLDELRVLLQQSTEKKLPVLLVPHACREKVWSCCRPAFEDLTVISPAELPFNTRLDVVHTIGPALLDGLRRHEEFSPETLSEFWQRKPR